MRRNEDTFQKWKKEGLLESKLAYLRGASSNFYSQKKMAHDLGITEATFITLKNKYKQIREALNYGDELLKADVMSALKKRAVGFVSVTKVRSMKKDGGGRNYQAVQEVEKEFPPDVDAARTEETALKIIKKWNDMQDIYHWVKPRFQFKKKFVTSMPPYELEQEQISTINEWSEHSHKNL